MAHARTVQLRTSAVAHPLRRAGAPNHRSAGLAALQRQAGNRAVAGLVAAQRCGCKGGGEEEAVQRAEAGPEQDVVGPTDAGGGGPLTSSALRDDDRLQAIANDQGRLRVGDRGDSVRRVQAAYIAVGVPVGASGADGAFGQQTGQAAITFKRREGLKPDTINDVGPLTVRRLDELLKDTPSKPDPDPPNVCPVDPDPIVASSLVAKDGDVKDASPCDLPAGCPPPVKATSIDEYVELLRCAETILKGKGFSTEQILTSVRQIYFGSRGFSHRTTGDQFFSVVIPCESKGAPDLGDATVFPAALLTALKDSQEVGGIDVGHTFCGVEASFCPSLQSLGAGGLGVVNTSNVDFVTWSGDVGSAAADHAVQKAIETGAGGTPFADPRPAQPAADVFTARSSDTDLAGDIDGYAIAHQLEGSGACTRLAFPKRAAMTSVAGAFDAFYGTGSFKPGGQTKANKSRMRCFVTHIGGTIDTAGPQTDITNKPALAARLQGDVRSFASAFAPALMAKRAASDPAGAALGARFVAGELSPSSVTMTNIFLGKIQALLTKEGPP